MCETPDCWDVLADKMIGWMDPNTAPSDRIIIAEQYRSAAEYLRKSLPPSQERQVAIRKLLESYTWAMRTELGDRIFFGYRPQDLSTASQLQSIQFWIAEFSEVDACRDIGHRYYRLDAGMASRFRSPDGAITFERVQAARLLLESRDAAVRACLEMLAEQQKQELRVVSQS